MERWGGPRITNPLASVRPQEREFKQGAGMSGGEPPDLADLADRPTVSMRVVRPEPAAQTGTPAHTAATAAAAAAAGSAPLSPEEPEVARIREILVGPHLRDHERRLRLIERDSAESARRPMPAQWQAQLDAALDQERRAREQYAQAQAQTLAQLTAELAHTRAEREAHQRALQTAREEQQALRAELAHERQAREGLASRHVRALAEVASRLEHERDAHVRVHAHHATELDARLERERQAHAEELQRVAGAHTAHVESLRQLVEDAERALLAMQAERQHLAGLLAELGLHLVRHAASPAAHAAEQAREKFLGAASGVHRAPGAE
ncbi:MAG: hypothetical protein PVSMB4_04440 [Ktedonobacterales bacterium]